MNSGPSTNSVVRRGATRVRRLAGRFVRSISSTRPPQSQLYYQVGRTWEKAGDFPKAAIAYQSAVASDSSRPEWHFRLGRAYEKTGEWSKAAQAFQAAVDGDPSRVDWYVRLGRACGKAGNVLGAVTAYQAAVARDPSQPDLYYRLGKAYLRTRNYHSAAYCFRQADDRHRAANGSGQAPPSHDLPFERRIELSLLAKPVYAYCVLRGAQLAMRLGIDEVSVLEFGVAGGNGLLAMESHAAEVERLTGVRIKVFGLDTGEGLYQPADFRDLPYYFAPGHYRMDVGKLKSKLARAELILGDARETFAEFVRSDHPPIAAVSFDMDYYSSTSGVLEVIGSELNERSYLPRVYSYFDNVAGYDAQDYNEFTGELLAIAEFNERHPTTKFAADRHFLAKQFRPKWIEQVYTMHRFAHPEYNTYVGRASARSLRLRTPAAS